MLLGFGYLLSLCFISYFFCKAENNRLKKKSVGQNFVILFFVFVQNRVGRARRLTN